ncbi:TetR/AcrR family transcriptional regulator [Kibdelosporangium philippinense]|nr:TetR/AcrR family transcriptional regulator [Kibdelosporangium philippinense]
MPGSEPKERADAARNRQKILRAAAQLVATRGVESLALDEVAAAAGVGVGTVYRRYPDRGALAHALLEENEKKFQAAFMSGPPPLGPGASARERIRAFLHAFVDRLEHEGKLLMVAETETPLVRYTTGAYRLHHNHLAMLVAEAEPGIDAHFRADALLAPLAAAQFVYQRESGMSVKQIKAGFDQLLQ